MLLCKMFVRDVNDNVVMPDENLTVSPSREPTHPVNDLIGRFAGQKIWHHESVLLWTLPGNNLPCDDMMSHKVVGFVAVKHSEII